MRDSYVQRITGEVPMRLSREERIHGEKRGSAARELADTALKEGKEEDGWGADRREKVFLRCGWLYPLHPRSK